MLLRSKFKYFKFEDYKKLNQFFKNRKTIRFYQSLMYLTQSKKFIYTIYKNCLIILKHGHIMHNKYVYAMMPPINLFDDPKSEIEVIDELLENGIKIKLGEEDLLRYEFNNISEEKGNAEFIYSSDEMSSMAGKDWGKLRNYYNRNNRFVDSKELTIRLTNRLSVFEMKELLKVNKIWYLNHKKMKGMMYYLDNFNSMPQSNILYVRKDKDVLAYLITEEYSNGVIITALLKNYNINWKWDINAYLMMKMATIYKEKYNKNTLMNIGAAVKDQGLYDNKMKYRPVIVNQLFDTIDHNKNNKLKSWEKIYDLLKK